MSHTITTMVLYYGISYLKTLNGLGHIKNSSTKLKDILLLECSTESRYQSLTVVQCVMF